MNIAHHIKRHAAQAAYKARHHARRVKLHYLKHSRIIWSVIALFLLLFGAHAFSVMESGNQPFLIIGGKPIHRKFSQLKPSAPAGSPAGNQAALPPKPEPFGYATIIDMSPEILEYAHGTVTADGQFWIGMRDHDGNPFPSNELIVFTDPADLNDYKTLVLPGTGDIETVVYDQSHDKIYAALSDNHALDLYAIDPHTYAISTIIATSSVDIGAKPAIVTDGTYIYGITDTEPSTVFRVRISDGQLTANQNSHILDGHSAAIGKADGKLELYFGGGISHAFEEVDPMTLNTVAETIINDCAMTDDMPYQPIPAAAPGEASIDGYVYIGCETMPYGERVSTSDMSVTQFSLPGESYGLFVYGGDLYNAARDGNIDFFPGSDIDKLERFYVVGGTYPLRQGGVEPQLTELFYSTTTQSLYFTAWLGIPGLFRVATSASTSVPMTAAAVMSI